MSPRSFAAQFWYSMLWCFCWVVCKLLFGLQVRGRVYVPLRGPVLLVANHQSHLDPVLIGVASSRQTGALARHSLFVGPFGWLIRSLGAVPIERGRAGLAGFKTTLGMLRRGDTLLVFPEGTRTSNGRLQPFQPGFCALARRSEAKIVPVAIRGAFDAMPRGSAFPRPRQISVAFCQPITIDQYGPISDDQLCEMIFQDIQSRLVAHDH